MISDYIIDFERINQLTSTIHDNPNGSTLNQPYQIHSISKNLIKQYIEIYQTKNSRNSDKSKIEEAIEILEYNKILISKSTIRNNKLNKILE